VKALKVLFLDIDGVLNSTRSCIANRGYPFDFSLEHMAMFDHIAVAMIRGLCAAGGVSVVVSSAWRLTHHWDAIGRALDLPTMGSTPQLPGVRGGEIAAWLAEHPEVTQYAIVDDDADMLPEQMPFFVKTNGHEGLSFANLSRLAEIFGINVHACAPTRTRVNGVAKLVWADA
jgi:hypothetical protein